MSARLLADENIDDETCGFLRGMGHGVTFSLLMMLQ